VTSTFSQSGLDHLFVNMFTLVMMAPSAVAVLGPRRFLGIYLAGGVVGNLFMWGKMAYLNDYTSSWCVAAASRPLLRLLVTPWCVPPDSLGASGSVSAVTVMTAMMFPHSRILLFMVVPIPARVFAGLFIAYETYNSYAGNDRIGRLKLMSRALGRGSVWFTCWCHAASQNVVALLCIARMQVPNQSR
jgi:membrane associated rhomboid family serine protease